MEQYQNFSVQCNSSKDEDKKIYYDFLEMYKEFLIDEDMELYQVPFKSEEYFQIKELEKKYRWDWESDENRDDYPGFYVDETAFITHYSKSDYNNAVAYIINYHTIVFSYETIDEDDYVGLCCENANWECAPIYVQKKEYLLPKSEFGKKKYAQTMLGYAVSIDIRNELMEAGFATKNDFRNINDKKGEVVCYQMDPQNIVKGFAELIEMYLVDVCKSCGMKRYVLGEEPYYINQSILNSFSGLAKTEELFGPVPEPAENMSERKIVLEPCNLIDKRTYEFLISKYPRMEFIPVFLK